MKRVFVLSVLILMRGITAGNAANYLEYKCECGCDPDWHSCYSMYQNVPECTGSVTTNCRVSGGNERNFVLRTSLSGADQTACGTCNCSNRYCGLWESDENNVSSRGCYRVYDKDSNTCSSEFEVEFGCGSGYYYASGSQWGTVCNECPAMVDINGVMQRGISEEGNSDGCSACVMKAGYTFRDATGTYTFVQDCNASC